MKETFQSLLLWYKSQENRIAKGAFPVKEFTPERIAYWQGQIDMLIITFCSFKNFCDDYLPKFIEPTPDQEKAFSRADVTKQGNKIILKPKYIFEYRDVCVPIYVNEDVIYTVYNEVKYSESVHAESFFVYKVADWLDTQLAYQVVRNDSQYAYHERDNDAQI